LWAIYLVEEHRGKGYGSEALKFALNKLKHLGHEEISLWVFEENYRARHFYEKHLFQANDEQRMISYGRPLLLLNYERNF
jgi:GNAT superfamily N-acetyltransferase